MFTVFTKVLNFPWLPVSICTFILATTVNYVLSIRYVFESGVRHQKHIEIIGVFIISSSALLVNQIALYIAIEYLHIGLVLSKISATCIVFLWNYFGRSKLIF
ncbi:GtrA family protein [Polynucleobacter paneuropaeus]|nr:GtrA family protein [Polynucleobacter paneuropaeus]